PPRGPRRRGLAPLAAVRGGVAGGETRGEAVAERRRQRGPVGIADQRAEAQIAQEVGLRPPPLRRHDVGFGRRAFHLRAVRSALPSASRRTMRDPRRIRAASFGFGTVVISAYQRSLVSTKSSISFRRWRATGWMLRSLSAWRTQACSAVTAGSSSRSLRPAAMRVTISHRSVSASKWSRRSPLIGTRRIRFHASSSLIEVDTLERASPSGSAISSAVGGPFPRESSAWIWLTERLTPHSLPMSPQCSTKRSTAGGRLPVLSEISVTTEISVYSRRSVKGRMASGQAGKTGRPERERDRGGGRPPLLA